MKHFVELLSPAGSEASLKAAVNAGANAVYVGGKAFSARSSAENFSLDRLEAAADYCHLRDVRLYVAANTLIKDTEKLEFLHYIEKLSNIGVDAFILQDMGMASAIRQNFPIRLHASTQMFAHHIEDVKFLHEQGFSRVVMARELTLEELKKAAQSPCEIEAFVHGALCYCYSGQCYFSSMVGGRSGNRGRCAQPCRLQYTLKQANGPQVVKGHVMSLKDLHTLDILPDILSTGIYSMKIEGRMKNPEYVAGVTRLYRKYLDLYYSDESYAVDPQDKKELLQIFNRGGFTQGYYGSSLKKDMVFLDSPKSQGLFIGAVESVKNENCSIRLQEPVVPGDGIVIKMPDKDVGTNISVACQAGALLTLKLPETVLPKAKAYKTYGKSLTDQLKKEAVKEVKKRNISSRFSGKKEMPLVFTVAADGFEITAEGPLPEEALQRSTTAEEVRKQLSKTGNTPFFMAECQVDLAEGLFIPVKALNELRRNALTALEKNIVQSYKKSYTFTHIPVDIKRGEKTRQKLSAYGGSAELLRPAIEEGVNRVYVPLSPSLAVASFGEECHKVGTECFLALPRVLREEQKVWETVIKNKRHIDGVLVQTLSAARFAKAENIPYAVDHSMNVFNSVTADFWRGEGASTIGLSYELGLEDLRPVMAQDCEITVYGRIPVMVTRQNPGTLFDSEENSFLLEDRKGFQFPVAYDPFWDYTTIQYSQPIFLLNYFDQIENWPVGMIRMHFYKESPEEIGCITRGHVRALDGIEDEQLIEHMLRKGCTKGPLFRTVE